MAVQDNTYNPCNFIEKLMERSPRYRLPPIEIDPVETQIWEAAAGGEWPRPGNGGRIGGIKNNYTIEMCGLIYYIIKNQ